MREVQADGFRVEIGKRHLVDTEGARGGVEVFGCVDVGAGVVGHGDVKGGGAERRVARDFGLVGVPGSHYKGGVEGVAGGAVLEGTRKVDQGGFLGGGCIVGFGIRGEGFVEG